MKDEEKAFEQPGRPAHPSRSRPHIQSLNSHPSSAAILLAAGRSRRMGAFKPLLPFGERTVAEACIANLFDGGVEALVVVLGHRAPEMRERLAHLPVAFALNTDEESEMGASIALGVEEVAQGVETILIALCDQPAIPPEVIRFLLQERRRTGARLVVPQYLGRGGHPVLIDRSLRAQLLRLDREGGLRSLFSAHREEVLRPAVASPYVARDMDTWDDYRALHLEVFGVAPPPRPAT